MRISSLLSALSSRLVEAGVITMDNDFAGENMPPLRVDQTEFWIHENYLGHGIAPLNTKRRRIMDVMVQYDLYVPLGGGTMRLDEKTEQIERLFDPNVPENSDINGEDFTAKIIRLQVDEDMTVGDWCMRPVLIYISVASHA